MLFAMRKMKPFIDLFKRYGSLGSRDSRERFKNPLIVEVLKLIVPFDDFPMTSVIGLVDAERGGGRLARGGIRRAGSLHREALSGSGRRHSLRGARGKSSYGTARRSACVWPTALCMRPTRSSARLTAGPDLSACSAANT